MAGRVLRDVGFEPLRHGVRGSWLHGPPRGEWHPDAWREDVEGCHFPQGQIYRPCGRLSRSNRHRLLSFFTGLFNLTLDIKKSLFRISTPSTTSSFRPGSRGLPCAGPRDVHDLAFPGGYPVRLVTQGRYLHHWLIVNLTCGDDVTASLELRVWPDCLDVHAIGEKAMPLHFLMDDRSTAETFGYAAVGFCGARQVQMPSDCCPLGEGRCGFGPSSTCATPLRPGPRVRVEAEGHEPLAAWGDGHAWRVLLNSKRPDKRSDSHRFQVLVENPSESAAVVRLIFHLDEPLKITGVASVLQDASGRPSGIHLQLSKNWHMNDCYWGRIRYDGVWHSTVVQLPLPPLSRLQGQLLIAYQFFGQLHTVSHSQLSLIGWSGSNGLWEEVGIGAEGESITYEPNLQQRRSMVLDTRPFLVCMMQFVEECECFKESNISGSFAEMRCQPKEPKEASGCAGDVETTGWTENHGGSDFLVAVDEAGSYQYLKNVTSWHVSNGPLLSNASYDGVTADGAVRVSRRVSTWATKDVARHLHSFEYEILRNVSYPRFGVYVLGADWYNFVFNPGFAYGDERGLQGLEWNLSHRLRRFEYDELFQKRPCEVPCWFALLTPLSQHTHHAHRGLILRRFSGVPSFSVLGAENYGQRTLGLELSVAGPLKVGDVISGEVELVLYPKMASVYYGQPELHLWNEWEFVYRETQLKVHVSEGELQRAYPLRLRVSDRGRTEFQFEVPVNYSGVLPASIAGVEGLEGCLLSEQCGGDFQVDYVFNEGYVYTYSLPAWPERFVFESNCG